MARERSRGRLSPKRGREKRDSRPIGIEATFASQVGGGGPGGGDMLISTYDPTGINQQLVGVTAAQNLSNKTHTSAKLLNSLILDAGAGDFTVIWAALGTNRQLSIRATGADDFFVFEGLAQILAGKTLLLPVIADFSNATHDHSNDAGGGTLVQETIAWATGPVAVPHSVTTVVSVLPLDTIQSSEGDAFIVSGDEITPPSAGTYEILSSTKWDCDDVDDGDLVNVVWQVFNSSLGTWENIAGH